MKTQTISKVTKDSNKSAGMPLFAKIGLVVLILSMAGIFFYQRIFPTPKKVETTTQPVMKPLFTNGQTMTAKCITFDDISLYLETPISVDDFNNILLAVSTLKPEQLTIPGQEVSFTSGDKKLIIYNCCYSSNVLMGKIRKK
jgi:hypothetical protein